MTRILTVPLNETSYPEAAGQIIGWSHAPKSRTVFVANVHVLMEAWDDSEFMDSVELADLITPDGMPLVWMMRLKGARKQTRVYGPTLMLHVLECAAREGIPVGFYGAAPEVLEALVRRMQQKYEHLQVAFAYSPPYRNLSPEEDDEIVQEINSSGARILFVGLGCPRQELWMGRHKDRVQAVMLGVGAAFDFHAGVKPQAPVWLQKLGLEWLFRLVSEPRRLWKRYLYHNPRFIVLAVADLLGLLKRAS